MLNFAGFAAQFRRRTHGNRVEQSSGVLAKAVVFVLHFSRLAIDTVPKREYFVFVYKTMQLLHGM